MDLIIYYIHTKKHNKILIAVTSRSCDQFFTLFFILSSILIKIINIIFKRHTKQNSFFLLRIPLCPSGSTSLLIIMLIEQK